MLNDLRNQHLSGSIGGQVAVCSAHPQVLLAAADQARRDGTLLLVEATANQVNLTGGYTGMTPADFADFMKHLAGQCGLAPAQIALLFTGELVESGARKKAARATWPKRSW